ncbi:outer membrane beta-barrel protein [Pontibacter virosus]|uniref:Outer membrane protein with beta-barrel domain n=1 Tax=Pontibacter virosus TaxID=1765052 RepID=A0A2U1B6E1_9BACT|nr:outer membrane beta-barrel protein [Pontibacter virosus]PVY44235.1 outer membrane protein with beta-barrel domain [Pontibacter virosus]
MKHFLLVSLALAALLTPFDGAAQTFRPGFIVQAAGDTTKGLVRYREGKQNYKSCHFKTADHAEATEYFPADIQAYGIVGEAPFMSKEVPGIEGAPSRMFIEVLEQGKLMLYTQDNLLYLEKENSGLKHLYLQTDDQDITMHIGERKVVNTSTQHLILINSLTLDCPVPDKLMLKVRQRLHVPNVTAIVRSYNNCAAPTSTISYKENQSWLKTELGVFAGGYSTALQFNHNTTIHWFKGAKMPSSSNFVFGAVFNFTSPKKSERLSVQIEPMYSKEHHAGTFEYPRESYVIHGDYTIDLERLSLPIMLRYTITTNGRFSPYVGAGITNDYILSGDAGGSQKTVYHNGLTQESAVKRTEIGTTFSHAFTSALGVKARINDRHSALLQFRYEYGRYLASDLSNSDSRAFLNENHQGFYLTAAYLFK